MPSNPPIPPALTEAEWARELEDIPRVGLSGVIEGYTSLGDDRLQAVAALALYDQPFGIMSFNL